VALAILERISFVLARLRDLVRIGRRVNIAEYLDDRLVVFLDVETRDEAITTLVDALDLASKLKDKEAFHHAILEREKIVSTGIGLGVAVPHTKLPGYDEFFIAIGIQSSRGIDWNSIDGSQVHLIFMIGGPHNKQTEYLKILSGLTVAIKDPERRKEILKATSAIQVIELFKGC
jgi:PTS system nitrogen regulatory IIA component